MDSVLNFDKELDVGLLDRIVQTFYTGAGPDVCSHKEASH